MIGFALRLLVFLAPAFGRKQKARVALGSITVYAFVLAFLIFVDKAQVLGRLGDLNPGIRLQITKDSLRMFTHRPVWGWGLGTFPTVYPGYRSFYTNLFINEGHNDYVQLLVETVLLALGLMVGSVFR